MSHSEHIGLKIQRERIARKLSKEGGKDWTQTGFALRVKVKQAAVSKWERQEAAPEDPGTLALIAREFGQTSEEFIKGTQFDPDKKNSNSTSNLVDSPSPIRVYDPPAQSQTRHTDPGGDRGTLDPLARASLQARVDALDVVFVPPADQEHYGQRLTDCADLIDEVRALGRALAAGQVAIVSLARPARRAGSARSSGRTHRVAPRKKP